MVLNILIAVELGLKWYFWPKSPLASFSVDNSYISSHFGHRQSRYALERRVLFISNHVLISLLAPDNLHVNYSSSTNTDGYYPLVTWTYSVVLGYLDRTRTILTLTCIYYLNFTHTFQIKLIMRRLVFFSFHYPPDQSAVLSVPTHL